MNNIKTPNNQRGAESLEFVAIFFFYMLLIMAVLDFGRALYTWNLLTETTRRGARMAVICPLNDARINQVALFDGNLEIHGLENADIATTYYTETGAIAPDVINADFVEVSIAPTYQFQFLIPGLDRLIQAPNFRTTLFMESKGKVPGAGDRCDF